MTKKGKKDFESVEIQRVKGSGPGGQNRNKRETGIVVRHTPTGITVRSTERRSQNQNLSSALRRLGERLEDFYHVPKERRATKKSRASQESRIRRKKAHASKKQMRQKSRYDD